MVEKPALALCLIILVQPIGIVKKSFLITKYHCCKNDLERGSEFGYSGIPCLCLSVRFNTCHCMEMAQAPHNATK